MIETDINFEKLNSYINNLIKKDLCTREMKCCPHCKSEKYIKYGTYKKVQRFKCKLCKKTFSFSTGFIWSYSKKKPEKWVEFLELMLENRTLRACDKKLKINLGTAFYWRHKLLYSFIANHKIEIISGDIHLGKGVIKENFKGCRNILSSERNEIWIAALKGDNDNLLFEPVCKKYWNMKSFNEKVYTKINEESYIIPYSDRYMEIVAEKHNKVSNKDVEEEDRIRFFRVNFKLWIRRFRGIGTKYLKGYLEWFVLINLKRKINYLNLYDIFDNKSCFIKSENIREVELQF